MSVQEISALQTGSNKYAIKDAQARTEISSKIKIAIGDDMSFQTSDLSVCKISQSKYAQLLSAGTTSDKCLYIVSSDAQSNYGQRLQDVATPTADTDAANKAYVDANAGLQASDLSIGYVSSEKKIKLLANGSLIADAIDCTAFIKDGMLNSAVLNGNYLVLTFNTDAGKSPISVNLSSFVDNYDTKITALSNAIDNKVTIRTWSGS